MATQQAQRFTPSSWGFFHDGVIEQAEGALPGELILTVDIGYLRAMFAGEGSGFRIHLSGCTRVRYCEYDEEPTDQLEIILEREPEILSVITEQPLVLQCVMGELEIDYESMFVKLESGIQLSEREIADASELYWSRWRERS